MEAVDEAVIRAAVTLTNKWRAFREGDTNEEPDGYSVPALALEKAVDARQKALEATTSWVTPRIREDHYGVRYTEENVGGDQLKATTMNPSITVGTQVRLTGVVVQETTQNVGIRFDGAEGFGLFRLPKEALEVIRQPFKRGEVVWSVGDATDGPGVVLNDEQNGMVDVTDCETGATYKEDNASGYERRPSRPKEER